MSASDESRWLDEDERRMWMRLVGITILLPGAVEDYYAALRRATTPES